MIATVHQAPADDRLLCLFCDNELTPADPPEVIIILHAARDDPGHGACNGICPQCRARYPTWDTLKPHVFNAYREVYHHLRTLQVQDTPGRA
jgi:hypothetical protein